MGGITILNKENVEVFAAICFGICLRSIISLHLYSGHSKPPMFGDYEAQRHWQEITINVHIENWYQNTTSNNLEYWGLDYPPLTAYHSYILGEIAHYKNENFVKLFDSRGYESSEHKSFMRLSVLFFDVLLYIPCIIKVVSTLNKIYHFESQLPVILLLILYPGQILIDNGHFQYNNISLALFLLAVSAILDDQLLAACLYFTLGLNYKQMELYHAFPFFVYILRQCFINKSFKKGLKKVFAVAVIVIVTFLFLWLPWLKSYDSIFSVIKRLFPIGRGIFEDKVSNIWCAINVLYKLKKHLTNSEMALLCLIMTGAAILPINFKLFLKNTKRNFLYCIVNTAMCFFLFSFQVHEKSILLVALPACLLFMENHIIVYNFLEITMFSMFPLFLKDQLTLAYFCLVIIYHIIINIMYIKNKSTHFYVNIFSTLTFLVTILVPLASILIPPSLKYPDIWSLLISMISCYFFIVFLCYGICKQFEVEKKCKLK